LLREQACHHGLDSLNTRRIRLDLVFMFKLISGEVDLKFDEFLQFSSTGKPNRNRQCLQLHSVNYPSNNFGRYNYFYRTHRIFNVKKFKHVISVLYFDSLSGY